MHKCNGIKHLSLHRCSVYYYVLWYKISYCLVLIRMINAPGDTGSVVKSKLLFNNYVYCLFSH